MLTFYPYDDIRSGKGSGRALLKSLVTEAPETFQDSVAYVVAPEGFQTTYNTAISGLLVEADGDDVLCVAVLHEAKVDRIYVPPHRRRRGHAKQILIFLKFASMMADFSFTSPVEQAVVPVFLAASWTLRGKGINPDGTVDMVSNAAALAPEMDIGGWFTYATTELINR